MNPLSRSLLVAALLSATPLAQAQLPIQIPDGLPGQLQNSLNAALRVRIAPPALRQEAQPAQPGPNYFWVGGYWNWRPRQEQYVWMPGHWEQERPNYQWMPAQWVARNGEYIFVRGRWARGEQPDVNAGVWVSSPPPALQLETPPPAPSALHIWIGGHWDWNPQRVQYTWVPGHYEQRREGYAWVPVRWEHTNERWRYVPGHWQRVQ